MAQRLVHDAAALGVALAEHDAARLQQLLEELAHWNRSYNLTGIADLESMVSHHVLDSLAVHRYLHGAAIADVGTGAGFPGLPLALVNPERRFTLIDSNGKKIRFVSHAVRTLGLMNVEPLQARAETLRPDRPFDTVLARAFAPLPELLQTVTPLCGSETRVLAMKGKWPQAELDAVPRSWHVVDSHTLTVPGLPEARCLIVLTLSSLH